MKQIALEIVITFLIALLVGIVVVSLWAAGAGGGRPDIPTAVRIAVILGFTIPIARAFERARSSR